MRAAGDAIRRIRPSHALFAVWTAEYALAAVTAARRLSGTMDPPAVAWDALLAGFGMFAAAVLALFFAWRSTVSVLRQNSTPRGSFEDTARPIELALVSVGPSVCMGALLSPHPPFLTMLSAALIGATACAGLSLCLRKRRHSVASIDVATLEEHASDAAVHSGSEIESPKIYPQHEVARAEATAAIEDEESDGESAEVEADDGSATQRTLRTGSAADGERLEGVFHVAFEAGSKHASLHIPFLPPFDRVPRIDVVVLEGDEPVRATVAAIYRYGARIDLRRSATAEAAVSGVAVEASTDAVTPRAA